MARSLTPDPRALTPVSGGWRVESTASDSRLGAWREEIGRSEAGK